MRDIDKSSSTQVVKRPSPTLGAIVASKLDAGQIDHGETSVGGSDLSKNLYHQNNVGSENSG